MPSPVPLEPVDPDAPYTLKNVAEQERRVTLLNEPHMQPLAAYLRVMRSEKGDDYAIPEIDSLDGGVAARALLLLEAPGPKAVATKFVSQNNPDPTAKNLCVGLKEARIPRREVVIWNIVPWYIGDGQGRIRAATPADIRSAHHYTRELLALLPKLEVIMLLGKKAQSAAPFLQQHTDLPLVFTPHPSIRVFNASARNKERFDSDMASVALRLGYGATAAQTF